MNSVQELTETDNFWNCIDENEKKKTAMQILSLMYLLNPKHIELQLDDKAKLEKIKTWVEEYK